MKLDAGIDVRTLDTGGVLLEFVVKGKRTSLRLSRKAGQQLAVVLAATTGQPAPLYERGVRLNLSRARHVAATSIDALQPASSKASVPARSLRRGTIIRKSMLPP